MRAALVLVIVLAVAQPAAAATVRVLDTPADRRVVVRDDNGERNQMVIRRVSPARYAVSDASGAALKAGRGCRPMGTSAAVCFATLQDRGAVRIHVFLGRGDDTFAVRSLTADSLVLRVDGGAGEDRLSLVGAEGSVVGGAGDDVLTTARIAGEADGEAGDDVLLGGPSDDHLDGGEGDDVIRGGAGMDTLRGAAGDDQLDAGPGLDAVVGGPGRDRVRGGPGNDTLAATDGANAAADDRIDGGSGVDTVSYSSRRRGVVVRLGAPGSGGVVGERDLLTSVENVSGGRGDDTLIGDDGPNALSGGAFGSDTFVGNDGDDWIAVTDRDPAPAGDRVSCGPGRDVVSGGDISSLLDLDCESLPLLLGPPVVTADAIAVTVLCLATSVSVATSPTVYTWLGNIPPGRSLGTAPVSGGERSCRATVPLNDEARSLRARPGPIPLTFTIDGYGVSIAIPD